MLKTARYIKEAANGDEEYKRKELSKHILGGNGSYARNVGMGGLMGAGIGAVGQAGLFGIGGMDVGDGAALGGLTGGAAGMLGGALGTHLNRNVMREKIRRLPSSEVDKLLQMNPERAAKSLGEYERQNLLDKKAAYDGTEREKFYNNTKKKFWDKNLLKKTLATTGTGAVVGGAAGGALGSMTGEAGEGAMSGATKWGLAGAIVGPANHAMDVVTDNKKIKKAMNRMSDEEIRKAQQLSGTKRLQYINTFLNY